MREIIFRGKRIDDGEWIYGHYVHQCGADMIYFPNGVDYECGFDYYHIDPETVGQCTGLTDKNGKKIFEGDIICTDLARPYLIVEFRDGCFMFNCNDGGEDYYDIMLPIRKEAQTQYEYGEIIGNIHDNPELLKGGVEK